MEERKKKKKKKNFIFTSFAVQDVNPSTTSKMWHLRATLLEVGVECAEPPTHPPNYIWL